MSKELERIKRSHFTAMACLGTEDKETEQAIETVENREKALDIIINGYADLEVAYDEEHDYWELRIEIEEYHYILASGEGKEEYELLKEVLKNA